MTTAAARNLLVAGALALAAAARPAAAQTEPPAAAPTAAPAKPPAKPPAAKKGAAPDRHCRPGATALDLRVRPTPEWYGLYLGDAKVGWLRTSSAEETREGKPVRVTREAMLVEVKVGDRRVRREMEEERAYEAAPRGRLVSLRSSYRGDGGDRTIRVACGPATCRAEVSAADGTRALELPHPGETLELGEATRLAALACRTVAGPQLQSDDLRVKSASARYAGRSHLGAGGVDVPVSVVEEKEEGDRAASRVLVADDGRVLETRVGDGMVVRHETAETARRLDLVDLFTAVRVPLPRALPREVPMAVTYTLKGVPAGFDLTDARQRVAPGRNGEARVTVTALPFTGRDVPRGRPAPRGDADQAATIEIDWEDPSIQAFATSTVGEETGTWAATRKLVRAVHDRLAKVYGQSQDRASEALRQGRGDCTEHTRLLVALARASGIRAREVKGLVQAEYGQGGPALYWHAWAEVKVGDDWVAVDPTFGQPVADATHLALGRGSRQDAIVLVGSLKVTGVEVARP